MLLQGGEGVKAAEVVLAAVEVSKGRPQALGRLRQQTVKMARQVQMEPEA